MYDHHVELIMLLKTAGDFDKTRAAREAMNLIFPLTEGTTIAKRKPKCQYGIKIKKVFATLTHELDL